MRARAPSVTQAADRAGNARPESHTKVAPSRRSRVSAPAGRRRCGGTARRWRAGWRRPRDRPADARRSARHRAAPPSGGRRRARGLRRWRSGWGVRAGGAGGRGGGRWAWRVLGRWRGLFRYAETEFVGQPHSTADGCSDADSFGLCCARRVEVISPPDRESQVMRDLTRKDLHRIASLLACNSLSLVIGLTKVGLE